MREHAIVLPATASGPDATALPRSLAGVVLTGLAAGASGLALSLILHLIQHLAYGYSPQAIISEESFLEGVSGAAPLRRVAALLVCGLVAGAGWWAVYRFGGKLVSVKKAAEPDGPAMPIPTTAAHALLQIITVALGSPLGREVAPREFGAMLAGWISRRLGLDAEERRLLVACGAGAGLAAVYNVPLGGAVFVLEVLLRTTAPRAVISAFATCAIATVVPWIGLGDQTLYHLGTYRISAALVVWALPAGAIIGVAAHYFTHGAAWARRHAPRDARLLPWCLAVFGAIGVAAAFFPALPGNGKGPLQLGFSGDLSLQLALALLVLKLLSTLGSLRAGAEGGLLTPGLTLGALIAVALGQVTGLPTGACAIVGATAFLAVSMRMPITAILLMMEFTRAGHDFLIPILAATVASVGTDALLRKRAP